ncbi:MAG: DUF2309 domain-containing protein [Planctomycetota bacterium]
MTVAATLEIPSLASVWQEVRLKIAPLWPLQDFVAVNPFTGMLEKDFLSVCQEQASLRDLQTFMPLAYFRDRVAKGMIKREDLRQALSECAESHPERYENWDEETLNDILQSTCVDPHNRLMLTFAERLDRETRSHWSSTITEEISRHCSAHFDTGHALWPSPWQSLSLYQAWLDVARIDRRMESLGIGGFRRFVAQLPSSPMECVQALLEELDLTDSQWEAFLSCELYSVSGWAAYLKYLDDWSADRGAANDDLLGLLAIRVAYDVALAREYGVDASGQIDTQEWILANDADIAWPRELLARNALQKAAEIAYRRSLRKKLVYATPKSTHRKAARMVFCIDVRSEVVRRHLESVSDRVETSGFAGFFGLPMELLPLGENSGTAQCPVLIKPAFRIKQTLDTMSPDTMTNVVESRRGLRLWRKLWKEFRVSATSCFSFVESMGLLYVWKLAADTMGMSETDDARYDGIPKDRRELLCPDLRPDGLAGLPLDRRVELARGMLRHLGLNSGFPRLVVFCGHVSETNNNPCKAGLDCGACGGHSGESNARVAASLLNDPSVRSKLLEHGVELPPDVWFLAALHNTTTDEIQFFDKRHVPAEFLADLQELETWVKRAGVQARQERAKRLRDDMDCFQRAKCWSQVRPEWGLAGNAAFIVAPRARTAATDLGGRVFLHDYDQRKDPDLRTLELIMTAPMVVTNWINMQYYASTVDNKVFGAGNKALHNVVGNFGLLEGNGGDLRTGLPWQSIHDGQQFQHEPLRLTVIIEATRDALQSIIDRHPTVAHLTQNGWITLIALEEERFYRQTSSGGWVEENRRRDSP